MNAALQQWILIAAVFVAGCATQPSAPADQADTVTQADAGTGDEATAETQPERVAQKPETEEVIVVNPELVCKYEKTTGTKVMERRCYSAKKLEEMEARSKKALRSQGMKGAFYTPIHTKDPRNRTSDSD